MKEDLRIKARQMLTDYFLGGLSAINTVPQTKELVEDLITQHFNLITSAVNLLELTIIRAKNVDK